VDSDIASALELLRSVHRSLSTVEFIPGTKAEALGSERVARAARIVESKLIPEFERAFAFPPVVAVLGGTNVGKSTLFNAVLGADVSSVDPRAGHTTSPVAAGGADADAVLAAVMKGYRAEPAGERAGTDAREGCVSVKELATPGGALFIDSPDVDSALSAHHARAFDALVASDVVLFVTSPTKYNDKRCVEFLLDAIAMGKRIVVLFNLLPAPAGGTSTPRADILDDFGRSVLARLPAGCDRPDVVEFGAGGEFGSGTREVRALIDRLAADAPALERDVAFRGMAYLGEHLRPALASLREQAEAVQATVRSVDETAARVEAEYEAFLRRREFVDLGVVLDRVIDHFRIPVLSSVTGAISGAFRWVFGASSPDDRRKDEWRAIARKEAELLTGARVAFAASLEGRASEDVAGRLYRDVVDVEYFARDLAAAWSASEPERERVYDQWLREFEAELLTWIASHPAARRILRTLKVVLELGTGVLVAVLTGGLGPGDLVAGPVAVAAAEYLVNALGRTIVGRRREEYVALRRSTLAAHANRILFDPIRCRLPSSPRIEQVERLEREQRWLAETSARQRVAPRGGARAEKGRRER
jgi:hypothetical protein